MILAPAYISFRAHLPQVLSVFPALLLIKSNTNAIRCQHSALTHNKSYRKEGGCVKISVTEGGKGDKTQHIRIRTGTTKPIFWGFKDREGQDVG
jgi:hypothetical protein